MTDAVPSPALEPFDEHNRALLENVRPPNWVNPEPADRYHLVVLGAGTAGLVTAAVAAGLGARVALVEKSLMGGDCLNVGCVPSKGVISAARAWHAVRSGEEFGAPPASGPGDFAKVMERMRRLRAEISHVDGAARFRDLGVDVFIGRGRFLAPDVVEVGTARLRFRKAVIATGARAAAPPITGLGQVPYLTNESVFSLTELPRRIAVIGAGPIGCEMAQAFARFGAEVSLLDLAPQILIREDRDAAAAVETSMLADGVNLELGVEIEEVRRVPAASSDENGPQEEETLVVVKQDGKSREIRTDALLVAVGRAPNVEGLGLEAAGVEYDRSGVTVNDRLQTTNRRIFAAGDIAPLLKFTHLADAHAGIVIQNALFFGRIRHTRLVVPWCTYTSPEIAHVGLYEKDAQALGYKTQTLTVPLSDVDRAVLDGQDRGFLRVILKASSDRILGATLVAEHAGEMISEITLAISQGIGLGKIAATIHPYPTQSEIFRKAANQWRKQKLSPTVKRVFNLWFRLLG